MEKKSWYDGDRGLRLDNGVSARADKPFIIKKAGDESCCGGFNVSEGRRASSRGSVMKSKTKTERQVRKII